MTIITVSAPEQRLSVAQRRQLAKTLTDAVLESGAFTAERIKAIRDAIAAPGSN